MGVVALSTEQVEAELPIAVLYDIFRDTSTMLGAAYVGRADRTVDPVEAAAWWEKVRVLRDAIASVDPHDRAALLDHVRRWRRESAELAAS